MSYISAQANNKLVFVWERDENDERVIKEYNAPFYFYVDNPNGKYKTIYNTNVDKIDCGNNRHLFYKRKNEFKEQGIRVWESDIGPELRVLSNHYYEIPAPKLHITFLDIEVDYDQERGFSSPKDPYAPINAISLFHEHTNTMVALAVPPNVDDGIIWTNESLKAACNEIVPLSTDYETVFYVCEDERELLERFIFEIEDSDLLSGWNSERFDFPYIGRRIEMVLGDRRLRALSFPNGNMPIFSEVEEIQKFKPTNPNAPKPTYLKLETSGRILSDYMVLYRKYEASEKPSYKLSSISEDVLVDDETDEPLLPKLEYSGSLFDLYKKNFAFFVRYNIRDSEILHGFEQKLAYVELANQMYHLSCGQFVHVPGTLKLAELAIVNYCHHVIKRVVNDVTRPEIDKQIEGALVLLPQIGMHTMIGSIDINSLYPTAIRSINISPEKLIGQFNRNEQACIAIKQGGDTELSFILETTKEEIIATASEWREFLLEKKWSISGYGTVFNQDSPGIIPTVLSNWFAQRKVYQAACKKATNHEEAAYYDRLQYVYKIKLNSLYGALSNLYFRFYDLRMGESTTGTGRMILRHQCQKTNEVLEGKYDIDIPMYAEMSVAIEHGHPAEVALDGPKFKGKFQSESIVYGDSVTGDTIIDTERDRIPIQSLFTKIDHTIGDKEYCLLSTTLTNCHTALTYDHVNNVATYKPIKYVMRHKCSKQLYRVWITNSQWIDVTEDHSLMGYVNTRHRQKYNNIISEVKPNQLGHDINSLVYVKRKPYHNWSTQGYTTEVYILMGLVLGDGYVDTTPTGGVLLSIGNKHIVDIEQHVLIPLQQQGWISSWTLKPNGHDVQISSVKLRKLLRSEMYSSGIKSIPNWMECESIPNIASFLKGWFSADGFINKNFTIGLCSINKEHIKIAQELLFKCGVSSTWFTESTENSYKGKYSNTFTKRLTVKSTVTFRKVIGFVLTDKQTKLEKYKEGRTKRAISQYDFELIKPIKIEKLPITNDYVYDIEIEDTHTFFANNILVHNTDSTYFKTWTDNNEDAIKIADRVATKVNESFPDYMRETFLCQPDFDTLVKTGREVVSDRGIFVEKKRYMLHLVDVEGKRVDKCKVMGLDTKKTTLPAKVSKQLNKFIEQYLKGKTWEEISIEIVEYKKQLKQSANILDIGLPKGVKSVDEYTSNWNSDSKTRLPGHVAASICYNQMLSLYNDKVSMPITSGMKIKVFYIKVPYGRFTSIAMPTDSDNAPDWFLDNFTVDLEAHITRLVDNPLQNILKAVNKKPPTHQSVTIESEWEF